MCKTDHKQFLNHSIVKSSFNQLIWEATAFVVIDWVGLNINDDSYFPYNSFIIGTFRNFNFERNCTSRNHKLMREATLRVTLLTNVWDRVHIGNSGLRFLSSGVMSELQDIGHIPCPNEVCPSVSRGIDRMYSKAQHEDTRRVPGPHTWEYLAGSRDSPNWRWVLALILTHRTRFKSKSHLHIMCRSTSSML